MVLTTLALLATIFPYADIVAATNNQTVREWHSVSGMFVEAEFVKLEHGRVHLKLSNGKVVAVQLNRLVEEDRKLVRELAATASPPAKQADTQPKPKSGSALSRLLGNELVDADGTSRSTSDLEAELIGLYFAASVSRPCRVFTPKLRDLYKAARKRKMSFEIVFISFDETELNMERHMQHRTMPWPAIPFGSSKKNELSNEYGAKPGDLPRLIIVAPSGKVISDQGYTEVTARRSKALDQWLEDSQKQAAE